jgi:hypothetical protein
MTLQQFRCLHELEQWQLVWGIEPIAIRTEASLVYHLFHFFDFYVEVAYTHFENACIARLVKTGLRCFSAEESFLEPYLQHVNLLVNW